MTRRPLNGTPHITGDTASHALYGVGPATDYGADIGEPIYAPFGGTVTRWWSTTGGNTVRISTPSLTFTAQHLSAYNGTLTTNEGTQIGQVGNTGTLSTGPHLHCWIEENSTRISFEDWYSKYELAATETTPIDNTENQEHPMARAVVNEQSGTPDFATIAVIVEGGRLHIVKPADRGWWGNLQACYNPRLEAVAVNKAQFDTFVAANQPPAG